MRTRDEQKKQALFKATVKLVNEIGFAASSVAKIAREADVSPSTLYVFFENKEDLLVSTYLEIKQRIARAILVDFDVSRPIRDIIKGVWLNMFDYISGHLEAYDYVEQFANSPYSSLVDQEFLDRAYMPITTVLQKGIEQKILKDVDMIFLGAFILNPISRLANPRLSQGLEMDDEKLEIAFTMTWDAIKL